MRKALWTLAILILSAWFLLSLGREAGRNTAELRSNATANDPIASEQRGSIAALPPRSPEPAVPPAPSSTTEPLKRQSAYDERVLAEWQAQINFYGKVVDENGSLVVGANIEFRWDETPVEGGGKHASTQSDSNGLFELHGANGPTLDVRVNKPGYYTSRRDKWSFTYAFTGHYAPNPLNPAVFHLRRKTGRDPLVHVAGVGLHSMRDYELGANGEPKDVSLHDGKVMPAGQGDLEIRFQSGQPLANSPSRITWQCMVVIPGGGLITTSDEFPFTAPTDNYKPSDIFNITATNWTETVNQQYYVKLRDGNYGLLRLKIIGSSSPYFRLESFLNQSGSTNLEPQ